jgi:hypothetical protein
MRTTSLAVFVVLGLLVAPALADHNVVNDRYFFNDSPWQLAAVLEAKADRLESLTDRQHAFVHGYGYGHFDRVGYGSHQLENLFDVFEHATDRLRSSLDRRGYVDRDARYQLENASRLARSIDAQLRYVRVSNQVEYEWQACREILFRLHRQL